MSKIEQDNIDNGLKDCPECDGKGHDESISDCCGDTRDPDTGLCFHCHDHCDPSPCPDCNGKGTVPYTDEDALNDEENENIGNKYMMDDD